MDRMDGMMDEWNMDGWMDGIVGEWMDNRTMAGWNDG